MCDCPLQTVHLNISGTVVAAERTVVLPAEVEADILGDDQAFAARGVVGTVTRVLGALLPDEPRRVVTHEGFNRKKTAADDQQVGLDDTVMRQSDRNRGTGETLTSTWLG